MKKYVRYAIFAAAAAALAIGLARGDAASVLAKAAAICLECIGIG